MIKSSREIQVEIYITHINYLRGVGVMIIQLAHGTKIISEAIHTVNIADKQQSLHTKNLHGIA